MTLHDKTHKKIAPAYRDGISRTCDNNFGIIVKERNHPFCAKHGKSCRDYAVNSHEYPACPVPLYHALIFMRAVILRRVGSQRIDVTSHRRLQQRIETRAYVYTRYRVERIGIDQSLNCNSAHVHEYLLYGHRERIGRYFHNYFLIDTYILDSHFEKRIFFVCVYNTQHGRQSLRKYGRKRRALYAPLEYHDEKNIQYGIESYGHKQKHKRRKGVAYRAYCETIKVVKISENSARKDYLQVVVGISKNTFFSVEKSQKRLGKSYARNTQNKSKYKSYRKSRTHRMAHFLIFVCAVIPRHNDAAAHSETYKQKHYDIHYGSSRAERSQSVRADKSARDNTVDSIIKLLTKIAYYQRHGKLKYRAERLALSKHIFCVDMCVHNYLNILYAKKIFLLNENTRHFNKN